MLKRILPLAAVLAVVTTLPTEAAPKRWWAGGGLGLAFGSNTTFISIEPIIGYSVTERVDVGSGIIFRYRDDDRAYDAPSTTDYGASLFVRYSPVPRFFVQGEYEYLSYELFNSAGVSDREWFGSLLAGGGFSQPMGANSAFFVSMLYNFSYDEDELSPYTDPWVLRAGVGFHF